MTRNEEMVEGGRERGRERRRKWREKVDKSASLIFLSSYNNKELKMHCNNH